MSMNIRRILSISSIAVLVASVLVAPTFAAGNPNCTEVDGAYIVTFSKGAVVANEIKNVNGRDVTPKFMYDEAVNGFAGFLTGAQVCNFKKRGNVLSVEADKEVSINATQPGATWGLDRIDQATGLDTKYDYVSTGLGVDAYVIDTGILASHTDFGGRVKSGYTAISDRRGTTDCNGHGTHVAGTIGGTKYGVAKAVNLIPVRVLDCRGFGAYSGVIAGVNWAISNHAAGKPAVANLSLGGPVSDTLDLAINNLIADGVTVVVAAGNSTANACNYSPSRVPDAITVAASTNSDTLASFSNTGSCVDIIAPGVNITSAWIGKNNATNTISGTSMASPHVAGAIARTLGGAVSITSSSTKVSIAGFPLLYIAPTS